MSMYKYFSYHDLRDLADIYAGYDVVFRKNGKSYNVGMQYVKDIHFKFDTVKVVIMTLHEKTVNEAFVKADTFKAWAALAENIIDSPIKDVDTLEVKVWIDNELHDISFIGSDNVNKEIYINIKN